MLDRNELNKLKNADIESCDKNSLTDIKNVKTESKEQTFEKMKSFVERMGNPYLFKVGDTVVKVEYEGRKTFNEAFANIVRAG